MKTTLVLIGLGLAALSCTPAKPDAQPGVSQHSSDQNSGPKPDAVNCGDLTTQSEMNECLRDEAERDRQLLDDLLKVLGRVLDADAVKRLNDVQRHWTTYRDAHCAWQGAFSEGGSIKPTVVAACLSDVTWARIDELKIDLCEGQGLTGPCEASRRYDRSRR